ncbi:MAG: FHA domain-containing protein [Candidatus Hydrogenedentes bacterium]|nr:FHA domain-containing protein [Candidatus Hydrogenedentota bacterium]
MRAAGQADCITIVNGPEDGTEFPIVRAPFYIGESTTCAVQIRLDSQACARHALVTVVSDGYRVRRMDRQPVYVNGKPAGLFRSRIVRNGGTVQIGHTLLCVECSSDGLASRSHGIVSEGDVGWAIQQGAKWLWSSLKSGFNLLLTLLGRIVTSWLAVLSILFLMYVFWPWFRFNLQGLIIQIYSAIVTSFS